MDWGDVEMTTSEPDSLTKPLVDWFNHNWTPSAIDGYDAAFLAALIEREKPRRAAEIGVATGLSTGLLACLMQQTGGGRIDAFDVLGHYYADPSKPVGYLIDTEPAHPSVEIRLHVPAHCVDVADRIEGPLDFCFIDAQHTHPWPLIDTLAVLPLMAPGGIIVHHDIVMFRDPAVSVTGPKVLLDQVPSSHAIRFHDLYRKGAEGRLRTRHIDDNIFAFRVPDDYRSLGQKLSDGFMIGWDPNWRRLPGDRFLGRFRDRIGANYGEAVSRAFNTGMKRYG
jgi:predicted O-methyltransferase YrrM